MGKHSRAEEGRLALVFLAVSLIIAAVVVLRHDTNSVAALMTVPLAVALMLTGILAGAWTGAWMCDWLAEHRAEHRSKRRAGRWPKGRVVRAHAGVWLETGALAGFAVTIAVIFRNFI